MRLYKFNFIETNITDNLIGFNNNNQVVKKKKRLQEDIR